MSCPSGGYSPSGEKPAAVVSDWAKRDWIQKVDFEPATDEDLALAHCPSYVSSIFAGETSNGHGNCDSDVAESTRWTVGSMVAAAAAAVQDKTITCSPSSGFHHAGYDTNHGFCTFNGLIVAARNALAMPGVSRVAVLDCDWHAGDGTQEIIDHLRIGDEVLHYSSGMQWPSSVPQYFDWLDESLSQIAQDDVDLILYQAGADAHKDDPLGGLLNNDELAQRDRLVFDLYADRHIPIAWNLAGGYQRDSDGSIEKVLTIHRATMHVAAQCLASAKSRNP
jgi:acetoin utilization deacetylase AcuC-like enzyme